MRLVSTKAKVPYIDQIDRKGGKPDGEPIKGHTKFYFRPLKASEEGALTDSMFDLGTTNVKAGDEDGQAEVGMSMAIKPSQMRLKRIAIALTGWDGLHGDEGPIEHKSGTVDVGGQEFEGTDPDLIDGLFPAAVLMRMERHVRSLSEVEAGEGNG